MIPCRRGRSAFTLIELLVVIAIIAILAAILFPVFAQAREKARQSSCTSNAKQIGTALLMYAQDYDEQYPSAFYGFSASGTSLGWPVLAQPYIKNVQVFRCPSVPQITGNPPGSPFPVTYAYNYYIGGNNNPNGGVMNYALPGINKPAETVMLVDSGAQPVVGVRQKDYQLLINTTTRHTPWLVVHAGSTNIPTNNTLTNYGAPHARHSETVTVAWADGHVKAMRPEAFYVARGTEHPQRPADAGTANWSPCLDPRYGCF
jgi:prepilin-type N-terminal cleavage/methylation domain-containing protein/prepilin-type processing-associated H-X9-DG protein